METELESFHPRHAVMLIEGDSTIAVGSFIRGRDGVRRITINDANKIRVEFESKPALRCAMSDGWCRERAAKAETMPPRRMTGPSK